MDMDMMLKALFTGDSSMKKHMGFWIRAVALVLLVAVGLAGINQLLEPEYFITNPWPTTATFLGFYEMERDTVDVLFLGSSHAAAAFSPQELYDDYGITSYNLGSEQQNLLITYYWLKEALHYQSPKAVVLDCLMLFSYIPGEVLNTAEGFGRKAIDPMRWGAVKREAIADICARDKKQSAASYYFTNLRFHSRWTDLQREDFSYDMLSSHYELKGYNAGMGFPEKPQHFAHLPFDAASSQEKEEPREIMLEYLNKILQLCRENGIEVILVKTPTGGERASVQRYNAEQEIAQANGLALYDFNERALWEAIDFNGMEDLDTDSEHLNFSGASKITHYLGKILTEEYEVAPRQHSAYESTRQYYQGIANNFRMQSNTDLYSYLEQIDHPRYTVFLSVKGDASGAWNDDLQQKLEALGLTGDLWQADASYYAIISEGEVVAEETGKQRLQRAGAVQGGLLRYEIVSGGTGTGNTASIKISGAEHSRNSRGINIVVYDNYLWKVIDSVTFDTHDAELEAMR